MVGDGRGGGRVTGGVGVGGGGDGREIAAERWLVRLGSAGYFVGCTVDGPIA